MAQLKTNSTVGGETIAHAKQLPPVGSVIGIHPDCTVTPDSSYWLYWDGATGVLGSNFVARSAEAPPNLTDSRFLLGSTAYGVGGSNDTSAHTHTDNFSIDGHAVTVAEMPQHRHSWTNRSQGEETAHEVTTKTAQGTSAAGSDVTMYSSYQGSDNTHTHGVSGAVTSSGSVASGNIPLYFKVKYYIRIV